MLKCDDLKREYMSFVNCLFRFLFEILKSPPISFHDKHNLRRNPLSPPKLSAPLDFKKMSNTFYDRTSERLLSRRQFMYSLCYPLCFPRYERIKMSSLEDNRKSTWKITAGAVVRREFTRISEQNPKRKMSQSKESEGNERIRMQKCHASSRGVEREIDISRGSSSPQTTGTRFSERLFVSSQPNG